MMGTRTAPFENFTATPGNKKQKSNLDVVFYGCGERNNKKRKTNNPKYRFLLEENWEAYSKNSTNMEKRKFILLNIIEPIKDDGGNFYSDKGEILNPDEIFEKVSQVLRDMRKVKKKKHSMHEQSVLAQVPPSGDITNSYETPTKTKKSKIESNEEVTSSPGLHICDSVENEIMSQCDILNQSNQELIALKDEILFLKHYTSKKLEDILTETIATQEELVHLNTILIKKDIIIESQKKEINDLRREVNTYLTPRRHTIGICQSQSNHQDEILLEPNEY